MKKRKVRNTRAKGDQRERRAVQLARDCGLQAERIRLSGMNIQGAPDLLVEGLKGQSRSLKNEELWNHTLKYDFVLLWKEYKPEPIVVLKWKDWIELLSRLPILSP